MNLLQKLFAPRPKHRLPPWVKSSVAAMARQPGGLTGQ